MRTRWFCASLILLCGCGRPRLEFNGSPEMTRDELYARASHIFVGVVESQHLEEWPLFHFGGPDKAQWKPVRRRVRIEMVLRGAESRKTIDIWEILGSGNRNFTRDGERAMFPVRIEDGVYHLVGDDVRCVYAIWSGAHSRLPMDDSHPFWERFLLMGWWVKSNHNQERLWAPGDLDETLGMWRVAKLNRGLLRHPNAEIRAEACRDLVSWGYGLTECWNSMPASARALALCCTDEQVKNQVERLRSRGPAKNWAIFRNEKDERRLLTTVNDPQLRAEFCHLYTRDYPGDTDNGCPADRPPPATIVTEKGDGPLNGPWPAN